ncbi:hypothetical protein [Oscillatoria sp. HE19RPO]|nr:hypothetical protein [Oscillatoria sp. HE19RPO]
MRRDSIDHLDRASFYIAVIKEQKQGCDRQLWRSHCLKIARVRP